MPETRDPLSADASSLRKENEKYFFPSWPSGDRVMRLLVAGQSGLDKMSFLNDLQQLCNNKSRDSCDKAVALDETTLSQAQIDAVLDLEKEFQRQRKVSNYLDMDEDQFMGGKDQILREFDQQHGSNKNLVVATHLTYFRKKSIFHRVSWDSLRTFGPDIIVTLIDNVHTVNSRIRKRSDPNDYVRSVTMKDLMSWREAEIMTAQTIADNLYSDKREIPHYLVALDHRAQILYQLMFEIRKKKIYASYPMTGMKGDQNSVSAVKAFVEELKKHFIVFDPGTIREKILHDSVVQHLREPLPSSASVEVEGEEYRIEELLPILPDIGGQIITRDERLIRQSDTVIAYRPALSEGARYELDYATQIGKSSLAFHPMEDGESPFAQRAGALYNDYQKFLCAIKELAEG
jgi:adenylate kinase